MFKLLRTVVMALWVVASAYALPPTAFDLVEDGTLSFEQAVVSWYGQEFAGRKTASGAVFRPEELTAAHKTLPFGQLVKFINPKNNRSVVVRITDRGPFVRGRKFDLSEAAALRLGIMASGVAVVHYAVLPKP